MKNQFSKVDISKVLLAGCLKRFIRVWGSRQEIKNLGNCYRVHNTIVIKTLMKVCSNKKRNFTDRISNDRKRGEDLCGFLCKTESNLFGPIDFQKRLEKCSISPPDIQYIYPDIFSKFVSAKNS